MAPLLQSMIVLILYIVHGTGPICLCIHGFSTLYLKQSLNMSCSWKTQLMFWLISMSASIKERFSQGDLVCISKLMQYNYGMQQDFMSVTGSYLDLNIFGGELEIYIFIPTCTCRINWACETMCKARTTSHHFLCILILNWFECKIFCFEISNFSHGSSYSHEQNLLYGVATWDIRELCTFLRF